MNQTKNSILLNGLDGSNPLAFLAALGTLRTLTMTLPNERIRMCWQQSTGAWRPRITTQELHADDKIIQFLHDRLKLATSRRSFSIGDNLNIESAAFRKFVMDAMPKVHSDCDREDADFLAAFGCEACVNGDGTIKDTGLRTMQGAGHQHFLKFFRDLVVKTDLNHIRRALLESWDYGDDGRGLNLRWDPIDDRRYALRWNDPSSDPIKTMRGANRLALEALPLLSTMPTASGLATTCFEGSGVRNTFFIWPIWNVMITLDVARSLLAATFSYRSMSKSKRDAFGIVDIFSSQRITTGKYRNFTPARSV